MSESKGSDFRVLQFNGKFEFDKKNMAALEADVVIAAGVIIKNRHGAHGGRIGGALFSWDAEEIRE